jgi:putative transposase
MPRSARYLVDGGYYHVVTRGNDRRKLFRSKGDYRYCLETIKEYLEKFQVDVVHYCLMPNHLHLLMKATVAVELPKFMQGVLQVYAGYFKKKYNAVGFVFQNRYKSHFITDERYLLECSRYIERNPLRARLINNLSEYPWSSFFFYAKGRKEDIITFVNPVYLGLAQTDYKRQELYGDYLAQERPYEHIVDQAFRI